MKISKGINGGISGGSGDCVREGTSRGRGEEGKKDFGPSEKKKNLGSRQFC